MGLRLRTLTSSVLCPPECWGRWRVRREGDDRGRDGWMASLTQWTWVWAKSRRWWRTGRRGVLQSMGSESDSAYRMNNNNASNKRVEPTSHLKTVIIQESPPLISRFPVFHKHPGSSVFSSLKNNICVSLSIQFPNLHSRFRKCSLINLTLFQKKLQRKTRLSLSCS